jgi:inhibin beta
MSRGCLWLTVVLFLSVSIVTCADCTERHHHHHHKHQPPPLPSAPCPNCVQPEQKRDEIRLETIKRQILSKLGLKEKPNVTSPVPREVILETLYRAEETGDDQQHSGGSGLVTQRVPYDDDSPAPSSTRPPESEPDDFYGRTSEIIAFAEPGKSQLRPLVPSTMAHCFDARKLEVFYCLSKAQGELFSECVKQNCAKSHERIWFCTKKLFLKYTHRLIKTTNLKKDEKVGFLL